MQAFHLIRLIPLWMTYSGMVAVVLLSVCAGFYLSCFLKKRSGKAEEGPVNTVVAGIMALLAFILAFTFGVTTSRFDARKELLLNDVNAIETTYLRTELIPEPYASEVRALLIQYVDIRIEMFRHPENIALIIKESERLQKLMWAHAAALAEADLKNADIVSLFVDSMNKMFDIQTQRITVGMIYRIPPVMWAALFALTLFSMFGVGFLFGNSGKLNWPLVITLSLAFSAVISLIADLDNSGTARPTFIQVNPQPLINLQQRINGTSL